MDQDIAVEDVVIPFRTYAWAVTGSVALADQLLMKCFERMASSSPGSFPTNAVEWFDKIDDVVVDWVSCEDPEKFPEHQMLAKTAKAVFNVQPDMLCRLLNLSDTSYKPSSE